MPFIDRRDAGRELGARLMHLRARDPVVLAIPRGGVIVADEVARALDAPLDVIVVRKIPTPHQLELAMGAIAEGDINVFHPAVIEGLRIPPALVALARASELAEVERRVMLYREGRSAISIEGRTVIIVDEGLATGMTARAAARAVRGRRAAATVLAIPVGAPEAVRSMQAEVDEVVCLDEPANLWSIRAWFQRFEAVQDDEVIAVLRAHLRPTVGRSVRIPARGVELPGDLTMPFGARGVVIFAHGSGSSRQSPRNRAVARMLNERGLGTLLFDLLTGDEAVDRRNVFNIDLLTQRLEATTQFVRELAETRDLPVGYFGASTGAAAALSAASIEGESIAAVVSRGGRPDLAMDRLSSVRAPTLLIVGEHDVEVLELNRAAQRELRCTNVLEVVDGATHLFEERGALNAVGNLAAQWFADHLGAGQRSFA